MRGKKMRVTGWAFPGFGAIKATATIGGASRQIDIADGKVLRVERSQSGLNISSGSFQIEAPLKDKRARVRIHQVDNGSALLVDGARVRVDRIENGGRIATRNNATVAIREVGDGLNVVLGDATSNIRFRTGLGIRLELRRQPPDENP